MPDSTPPAPPANPPTPGPEATEGYSGACGRADDAPAPPTPADPLDDLDLAVVTEVRVAEVMELMLSGEFRRGQTIRQLAERWGVTPQRAREISAIASHKVRAQVTSPDELAAEVIPGMLAAFHGAIAEGDARGVAALGGQLLEVGGLKVSKTEIAGKDGAPLAPVILLPPETDD